MALRLGRRDAWRAGRVWMPSFAAAAVLEIACKRLIASERPAGRARLAEGAIELGGSFPSGHALYTGLVAALAWRLWARPAARAAALGWLAVVSGSRVALGAHWPRDVVAGAATGLTLGGRWPLPLPPGDG